MRFATPLAVCAAFATAVFLWELRDTQLWGHQEHVARDRNVVIADLAQFAQRSESGTLSLVGTSVTFAAYHPSRVEMKWTTNCESIGDAVCPALAQDREAVKRWFECAASYRQRPTSIIVGHRNATSIATILSRISSQDPCASADVISWFEFSAQCTRASGTKRVPCTVLQPIEPLLGYLRDPRPLCPAVAGDKPVSLTSRDFLILADAATTTAPDQRPASASSKAAPAPSPRGNSRPQSILLDLGASDWDDGRGGSSQSWLVRSYADHGIAFDRILMFEAEPRDPVVLLARVPSNMLHSYQYFNAPVSAEPEAAMNPLRMLRDMDVSRDDFVSLKLDIDAPRIENALAAQLSNSAWLRERVDEFFYEHHTAIPEMMSQGWKSTAEGTLCDTYRLMAGLRRAGVRAHAWP
mmetsp:Transcript_24428/g.78483  ORF Transcript_24428/g.78483 Transcript_24428/m.78483 type:complete len:410 (-) Transcript_24428:1661-2890(-)